MPIFGVKSSFLELGILAVQKRELIIEEVHIDTTRNHYLSSSNNVSYFAMLAYFRIPPTAGIRGCHNLCISNFIFSPEIPLAVLLSTPSENAPS